jgi:magnesium-transporting ATPase (P-type)
MMVFDKTGTLTEDGLTVYGFVSLEEKGGKTIFKDFTESIEEYTAEYLNNGKSLESKFLECIVTCHSIT